LLVSTVLFYVLFVSIVLFYVLFVSIVLFYVLLVSIVLFYVLFVSIVLFYVLFVCKCVLNNCHRVATQLQLNISYKSTYASLYESSVFQLGYIPHVISRSALLMYKYPTANYLYPVLTCNFLFILLDQHWNSEIPTSELHYI
jgi:hypothetical protein